MGQVEEGLSALAEALALVDHSGECWWEAELYRLKGTLTLQSQTSPRPVPGQSQTRQDPSEEASIPHPTPRTQAEAETCFCQALNMARRVVSLQHAGKSQRPAWRPSQGQKGLDERALMASQWPSHPW